MGVTDYVVLSNKRIQDTAASHSNNKQVIKEILLVISAAIESLLCSSQWQLKACCAAFSSS
jgi:hypothetical protein